MRRRFHWQLVDKITNETNFIWTQLRVNDFVKGQKTNYQKKEFMKRHPIEPLIIDEDQIV